MKLLFFRKNLAVFRNVVSFLHCSSSVCYTLRWYLC